MSLAFSPTCRSLAISAAARTPSCAAGKLDPLRVGLGHALEGGVKVEAWHARANAHHAHGCISLGKGGPGPLPGAWRQVGLGVGTGLLRREPLEAREHRLQRPLEGEHPVRAALRRGVLRAENSAYGQSYAQCLRAA